MRGLKVVNMENKPAVKDDAAIQHEIGEKTSLAKRADSGLDRVTQTVGKAGGKVVKPEINVGAIRANAAKAAKAGAKVGGKVVSAVEGAAEKAAESVDNEVVQLGVKSYRIASSAVRLGGKTVKVAAKSTGKVIKSTFKLSRAVAQKVHLAKKKVQKLKVKTSKLYKTMAAADATKKYVVKPAAKVVKTGVKLGANAAGAVMDKAADALGNIDNETAQFAKKAYDVARVGAAVTGKVAKAGGRTIKSAVKTTRKLTKKGKRGLVGSVRRRVNNVKRRIRRIRKAVKITIKALKVIVKTAVKVAKAAVKIAVKIVQKVVELIVETFPASAIVIGVVIVILIIVNIMTVVCGDAEEGGTAGLRSESGDMEEVYENLRNFETMFSETAAGRIIIPLSNTVVGFCVSKSNPQNIIEFNGRVYFPASGKATTINPLIENCVGSGVTRERYITMLAALKVLVERETGEYPDLFTKSDFETFIGTVNGNSCKYGDTFFIKTTSESTGETCPGANCRTKYLHDGCCTRYTESGREIHYCGGHKYCKNDHKKLTITLETVEQHTGKTIPEIYSFNDAEKNKFEDYKYTIGQLIEEMNSNSYAPLSDPSAVQSGAESGTSYVPPDSIIVNTRDWVLIAVLVTALIFGILAKRKG